MKILSAFIGVHRRLIVFFAAAALFGQTAIDLPPPEVSVTGGERFEMSAQRDRAAVWGRGVDIPRVYFAEFLPALFSRTLALDDNLPPGSALEWILTGDEGGITIRMTPALVHVAQRYYDSFGLGDSHPPKERFPEKVWEQSEISYSGNLRTVTLTLDHKLGLLLLLNGRQVLRQRCLLEVRRHQLAWTPARGDRTGRVPGGMIQPPAVSAEVKVNPARRHQTIYGFGGILSAPAFAQLSARGKSQWWKLVREYNLLIHREYPNGNRLKPDLSNFGDLADATPHYYGNNFPNGEITDFDYIRQLRRMGGHVLFEFWELPSWARKNAANQPDIPEYVRAMVGYCRILRDRTGAAPEVVGVQNEIVQTAATWHEMILALRAGLERAGFQSTRIHMPDSGSLKGGIRAATALRQSPEVWNKIDFAATHVYDFQDHFEDPDVYDAIIAEWKRVVEGKPFLSTEISVNHSPFQARSYRLAFSIAELYHKNMALMDAACLNYCWTLLDVEQPSFAATRSLFAVNRMDGFVPAPSSFQLRAFGAFSRRLREGMVRIDAESSHGDLLVTAYQGKGGAETMILLNRSTAPFSIRLDWPNARRRQLEIASPYRANEVMPEVPVPLLLLPGEIATLFQRTVIFWIASYD